MNKKSYLAFRTISETSQILDVPAHVLRFWEKKFESVTPLKRGGGRRYYRPKDITLLHGIKHFLYEKRFSIKKTQSLLKRKNKKDFVEIGKQRYPEKTQTKENLSEKTNDLRENYLNRKKKLIQIINGENRSFGPMRKQEIKKLLGDFRILKERMNLRIFN